jgi:RNA polymerase sigma factor (sigma-70 family)
VFNAAAGFKRKHKIWTDDLDTSTEAQRVAAQQPTEALQQDEQRHYLRLAMHRMLPDDATILTLFYLQEHTLDEIATVTGITADTVKVKLHRARKRLAEEMKLLLKNETKTLY